MQNPTRRSMRARFRSHAETLESRQLLAIDFPAFEPIGDLAYEAAASFVLSGNGSEQLDATLRSGKFASLILQTNNGDGADHIQVEARQSDGQWQSISATRTGDQLFTAPIPLDGSDHLALRLHNASLIEQGVSATLLINVTAQTESADQRNDSIDSAFDLDPYFVTVSESLDAHLANVRWTPQPSPETVVLSESFDESTLGDRWTFQSSYESGRVALVPDGDSFQLRMDATSTDPDNVAAVDAVVHYDPDTGSVRMTATRPFTAFTIVSRSGIFGGERPAFLDGIWDVFRADKLFLLDNAGVSDLDFGQVAPLGLTPEFLANDIYFETALRGGGRGLVTGSWMLDDMPGGPVLNSVSTVIDEVRIGDAELRFRYRSEQTVEGENVPNGFVDTAPGQFVAISDDGERWRTLLRLGPTGDADREVELDLYGFARSRDLNMDAPLHLRIQQSTLGSPFYLDDILVSQRPRVDWFQFTATGGDLINFSTRNIDSLQFYGPDKSPLIGASRFRVPLVHAEPTTFYVSVTTDQPSYSLSLKKNLFDRNDADQLLQSIGELSVLRYFDASESIYDRDFDVEFENGPRPDFLTVSAFAAEGDMRPLEVAAFEPYVTNADGSITIERPGSEPSLLLPEAGGYVLLHHDIGAPTSTHIPFIESPENVALANSLVLLLDEDVWLREVSPADITWSGPTITAARLLDSDSLELTFAEPLGEAVRELTIPAGYFTGQITATPTPAITATIDTEPLQVIASSLMPGDILPGNPHPFTVTFSDYPYGQPRVWDTQRERYLDFNPSTLRQLDTSTENGMTTVTYSMPVITSGHYVLHFDSMADVNRNGASHRIAFQIDESLPRQIDDWWTRTSGGATISRPLITDLDDTTTNLRYAMTLAADETVTGYVRADGQAVQEVRWLSPSGASQTVWQRSELDDTPAFSFRTDAAGQQQLELLLEPGTGSALDLTLARNVHDLTGLASGHSTQASAADLTDLLDDHPVSLADGAFLIDAIQRTTPSEVTWYAIHVEPGQSLSIAADPHRTAQNNEPWIQLYRDSELVEEAQRFDHTFEVSPQDQASTYFLRVTDVQRFSATITKNVSLQRSYAAIGGRFRLSDPLPALSRSYLDIFSSNSFSAFLQTGETLELAALPEVQTGTARLSVVDSDLNVLAQIDLEQEHATLRYSAEQSQYVAVVLEQLTGQSRVLLAAETQPNTLRENRLLGDLDLSGAIDGDDIDILYRAATDRFFADSLDLNQDRQIDTSDISHVLTQKGTVIGDLNLDGRFDDDDLAIVQQRYNRPWQQADWQDGDVSLDGHIDSEDLIRMFQAGGFSVE